jgi:hypothetical protein
MKLLQVSGRRSKKISATKLPSLVTNVAVGLASTAVVAMCPPAVLPIEKSPTAGTLLLLSSSRWRGRRMTGDSATQGTQLSAFLSRKTHSCCESAVSGGPSPEPRVRADGESYMMSYRPWTLMMMGICRELGYDDGRRAQQRSPCWQQQPVPSCSPVRSPDQPTAAQCLLAACLLACDKLLTRLAERTNTCRRGKKRPLQMGRHQRSSIVAAVLLH